MQTFLPDADYELTAQALDNRRLNKQILEGYQILKVLSGASPSGASGAVSEITANEIAATYALMLG